MPAGEPTSSSSKSALSTTVSRRVRVRAPKEGEPCPFCLPSEPISCLKCGKHFTHCRECDYAYLPAFPLPLTDDQLEARNRACDECRVCTNCAMRSFRWAHPWRSNCKVCRGQKTPQRKEQKEQKKRKELGEIGSDEGSPPKEKAAKPSQQRTFPSDAGSPFLPADQRAKLVEREDELSDLVGMFAPATWENPIIVAVTSGSGGIGKSALVSSFLHQPTTYPKFHRIYVNCDMGSLATIPMIYAEIAKQLIFIVDKPAAAKKWDKLLVKAQADQLQVSVIGAYVAELSKHLKCLVVVLDNFESVQRNSTLSQCENFVDYFRRIKVSLCFTMIRDPLFLASTQTVNFGLGVLSLDGAVALFTSLYSINNLSPGTSQRANVEAVVRAVDCVPLAVRTLALLPSTDIHSSSYRLRLEEVLQSVDGIHKSDRTTSVTLSLTLAVEYLQSTCPAAVGLVAVLAQFPALVTRLHVTEALGATESIEKAVHFLEDIQMVQQEIYGHLRILAPIRIFLQSIAMQSYLNSAWVSHLKSLYVKQASEVSEHNGVDITDNNHQNIVYSLALVIQDINDNLDSSLRGEYIEAILNYASFVRLLPHNESFAGLLVSSAEQLAQIAGSLTGDAGEVQVIRSQLGKVFLALAECLYALSKFKKAATAGLRAAAMFLDDVSDPSMTPNRELLFFESLDEVCGSFYMESQYRAALQVMEFGLKQLGAAYPTEPTARSEYRARFIARRGNLLRWKGFDKSAMLDILEAQALYSKLENLSPGVYNNLRGYVEWNLGMLYRRQKEISRSENCFKIAVTLVEPGRRSDVLLSWGELLMEQASHLEAESYESNTTKYEIEGYYDRAIGIAQSALKEFEDSHMPFGVAESLQTMGKLYHKTEKWHESIDAYMAALASFKQVHRGETDKQELESSNEREIVENEIYSPWSGFLSMDLDGDCAQIENGDDEEYGDETPALTGRSRHEEDIGDSNYAQCCLGLAEAFYALSLADHDPSTVTKQDVEKYVSGAISYFERANDAEALSAVVKVKDNLQYVHIAKLGMDAT